MIGAVPFIGFVKAVIYTAVQPSNVSGINKGITKNILAP